MDILGIVRTHLQTKVTLLKARLSAMALTLIQQLKQYGVQPINQKIQSAITMLRAWIKQSKERLHVQILIQQELLINHVSTHVAQIRGQVGKLRQKVVSLIPQRVLKVLKKGQ